MAEPVKHFGKWRIRWFDADRVRRSEVYSTREDARFALRRHEVETEEVRRGIRDRRPQPRKFGVLCDYWLSTRTARKRNPKDDESIIRCHLRQVFGELLLSEIGVAHVEEFMVSRAHLRPKTIHNHVTLLIAMLNYAVDLGWLARRPRIRKPTIRVFSEDYRFLTVDERDRLLAAARGFGDDVHALYLTAAYTGMRAGELAGLLWVDVDLTQRRITVQRSFDGPTKAGDVRYVPILSPTLACLREWRLMCPGKFVFPNRVGSMHKPSARIFQEKLRRVLAAAGFPPRLVGESERGYIVFHDLRHTFASHWVRSHGDLFKLQKILGHKTVQMTMRYAHLAPDAFVEDYDRLGATVASEPAGEVIELLR